MISTRSMKSLGIVDRLTRLPIAELDTVRRPSISTRVRLSPRPRSWIDDRPEFWVLPVTVESLSVEESCGRRSEEHTSELQSLMRSSYAVFCLKKKNRLKTNKST